MTRREILNSALNAPPDAIGRTLCESLRDHFPGLTAIKPYRADVPGFLTEEGIYMEPLEDSGVDRIVWEDDAEIQHQVLNGWHRFEWGGYTFERPTLALTSDCGPRPESWLIGERAGIDALLLAEGEWSRQDRESILVFEGGYWDTSRELWESIRKTRFDSLVLEAGLKEQIRADIERWLGARETYEQYGIAWKRGLIFAGVPGNGKTHTVKAIANEYDLRVLYVRNFTSRGDYDEGNIEAVFEKARKMAPCLLVLEDLDTLVTPQNRSYFLNEMDGFASNAGILTIGTANNPEKLDPALSERPSRFDRRYQFSPPSTEERERHLWLYTDSLEPALRLGDEAAAVAAVTEGFSFAYLKELVLSGMMDWISQDSPGRFADSVLRQGEVLGAQMRTLAEMGPVESEAG